MITTTLKKKLKANFNQWPIKFTLLASLTMILLFLIALIVFEQKINQPLQLQKTALLTVKVGTSVGKLSQQFLNKHWLENRFWLRNYPRIFPKYAKIKVGTYQIKVGTSAKQLLEQLIIGKEHQFEITFIEGTTFKQWLSLLAEQPYINHRLKGKSVAEIASLLNIEHANPEGLFFPDTYAYTAGTNELTILTRAYVKMKVELAQAWQNRSTNLPLQTPYQALIMASIIEKESGLHAEHKLISSVFVNRLNKGMRLQTDPTIIYGLGDRYQGDIKREHKREKTAYNTYRINGLPPTPIAMPGKAALLASLNPITSEYLYFVSNGAGKHIFSTNLADHNKAVVEYQLDRK
jgi:peptidoglycan lytic transglycosylase G